MNAVEAIQRVFDKCELLLDGEIFSKELLMRTFADFLADTTEKEKHNVAFVLHTGSLCFDALALVYAAMTCIVYNDALADDVVNALNVGDSVLYLSGKKKSRYIFKGFTTVSSSPGVNYIHLWKSDTDSTFVPQSRWRYVEPYNGSAKTMDGRGLKRKRNVRELFCSEVLGYELDKTPSVLNVSVSIVMPQDRVATLIDKLSIRFCNIEMKLTELVTVSYFTENDEHVLGGNAARTEPNIKVASKMSVARRMLLSRSGNKHIGLIVFGNETISKNISELPELINRRSIPYVYILMNMDYENALPLIRESENPSVFLCSKDFLLSNSLPTKNHNAYTDELSRQVDAVINRDIAPHVLNGYLNWNEYKAFKKAAFLVKNSDYVSEGKEDFIITACSLMNIFLTAVFSITDLEKSISDNSVNILSVEKRFEELKRLLSMMPDNLKEKADTIMTVLESAYLSMVDYSEKEEYLRQILIHESDKRIAIVVPKSYYATVMRECGFYRLMKREELLTITTANRFDNSILYDRIVIVGNFSGKRFDVFRCTASKRIETLLYDFESNLFKFRMRNAKKTEAELNSMNTVIHIDEEDDDNLYYSEDATESEVAEIVVMDDEVDDYLNRLREAAVFRGIDSYGTSQSTGQVSDVIALGSFDSGESIFFTKLYKAYVFEDGNGIVKEVSVKDLNEGDSLVFTKNNSEARDIVDTILSKLIEEHKFDDEIIECYRKSKYWKQSLRNYMLDNRIPAKAVAAAMIANGVNVQEITILGWLDEDSHTVGPRHEDSIQQIALLVEDDDMFENASIYHEACATIRRIRREILTQIGKAIIDKLSGRKPVAGTIMADVYERIDSIAQILRLEKIMYVERSVPMSLTNRPINF